MRTQGFYLNSTLARTLPAQGKVFGIHEDFKAQVVDVTDKNYVPPEGKDVVCVVNNGVFDAARVCNSQDVSDFLDPSDRYGCSSTPPSWRASRQ